MKACMRISAFLLLGVLAGCGGSATTASGGGTSLSTALAAGGATSVYVVQQPSSGTQSVLQFTAGANGSPSPTLTLNAPTGFALSAVAVDSSGQVYMGGSLGTQFEVLVYAAGASGTATPARTILVGTTNAYTPIQSMVTDASGSLYLALTSGAVSVYGPTASGAATPTRSITGTLTQLVAGSLTGLAVDASGSVYVSNGNSTGVGGSILVFSSSATGNVAPTRTITSASLIFYGIGVDSAGNIFVAEDNSGFNAPGVIVEFGPSASGAATPVKSITLSGTTPSYFGGLRVDAAGNLYAVLATNLTASTPTFSLVATGPGTTGTIAPADSLTSSAWLSAGSQLAIR